MCVMSRREKFLDEALSKYTVHVYNNNNNNVPHAASGGSTLGAGAQAPKSWLGPKFSRILYTLWSIDSQQN